MHVEQLKIEDDNLQKQQQQLEEKHILTGDNIANKTIDNIEDLDDDDMASQLNPDAKEFVPTSPIRSAPLSPFGNNNGVGNGGLLHVDHLLVNDRILAQSPRKNGTTQMDIIDIPSESEFDNEISKRPADIHDGDNLDNSFTEYKRPESSSSQCSEEELNPKEAMNIDEKRQEYDMMEMDSGNVVITPSAPPSLSIDDIHFIVANNDNKDDVIVIVGNDNNVALTNGDVITTPTSASSSEIGNANANYIDLLTQSHREQDPMSVSFYNDGTDAATNPFQTSVVDLNAVHVLPDFNETDVVESNNDIFEQQPQQHQSQNDFADEISKPEDDQYTPISETKHFDTQFETVHNESDVPESQQQQQEQLSETNELTSTFNNLALSDAATISPQFEAEDFVENIKNQCNDKYIDSGLSPNANEFNPFNDVSSSVSWQQTPTTTNDNVVDLDMMMIKKSINDSAESDLCLQDNSNKIITTENEPAVVITTTTTTETLNLLDDYEAATESDICMNNSTEPQLILMPEPSQPDLVILPNDPIDEPPAIIEEETKVAAAVDDKTPIESIPEPITSATNLKDDVSVALVTEDIPKVSAEDAAKAAAAVAAVAALVSATTVAAVAPAKKIVSQTKTTAKKSDIKSTKSAPIVTARKPTAAAPKSTLSSAKSLSAAKATSSSVVTEKLPPPIARPRTTAALSAAAPSVTAAPKIGIVEKKSTSSLTTTTSTTAATKKSPINGELKSNRTVLKKTSTGTDATAKSSSLSSSSSTSTATTVTKTATARSALTTKSASSTKPQTILVSRTATATK